MSSPVRLRITEIFLSLQGESKTVGWPTVFVRLTGCPLRCHYCDTEYAFSGGQQLALEDILSQVSVYGVQHVTVTGGEPLAQPACIKLLTELCEVGYQVSLETSGALNVASVDSRVMKVIDVKTPGSGEVERNDLANLAFLTPQDQVKFVICNRDDYEWSVNFIRQYNLNTRCECLFSPAYEQLAARSLADWIVADRVPVRMQVQLHKILWGEEVGR